MNNLTDNGLDYDLRSVQEVRDLARLGNKAQEQLASFGEERIDAILRNMVRVAEENSEELAAMAVNETGFGKAEDKRFKNHLASTLLYDAIRGIKTIGVISEDSAARVLEIAEPVGLLMGIVPSTNPTSTVIYKSIIALKSRNGIIFSPHPSAKSCTLKAAMLMRDAAVSAGAPSGVIGCISMPSMEATNELMRRDEIKMIIATGGPGMVKASYSAGKPALGVGAGNSPAYIERTADVALAVQNIITSKTFDYGTICASEQSVITEECNRDAVIAEFKRQGGYFMTPDETTKVCGLLFKGGHTMNAKYVGRSPQVIAEAAGISIPPGTTVLLGEQGGVGDKYPLSYEKLTSVLAFYTVRDKHEACLLCIELLQNGIGHTLSLHTQDDNVVMEFTVKPSSRILVNTGSTHGATGVSTGLQPAFTLGCGTWGGSSVSENVGPQHLINIKKVAYGIRPLNAAAPVSAPEAYAQVSAAPPTSTDYSRPPSSFGAAATIPVSSAAPAGGGNSAPAVSGCGGPASVTACGSSAATASCSSCGSPASYAVPESLTAETLNYAYASDGCQNSVNMGDKPITRDDLAEIISMMTGVLKGE